MKVICTRTAIDSIEQPSLRAHVARFIHLDAIDIPVGNTFEVLAVVFWESVPWYYIHHDLDADYPVPLCAAFFGVVDAALPASWVLLFDNRATHLGPPYWTTEFYERLVDGSDDAQALYEVVRPAVVLR